MGSGRHQHGRRHLGEGGAIHVTTDGGLTWRKQKSATAWDTPMVVAFANAKCGWLLGSANDITPNGEDDIILATTDGGATWNEQQTHTNFPLKNTNYPLGALACADPTHAWALGGADPRNGSLILGTTDGGAHWRTVCLTTTGDLRALAFADTRHGWVVGDGVILATSDGGRTWKKQGSVARYLLDRVVCADTTHAWAVGSDNGNNDDVILATTDGGRTWMLQYSDAGLNLSRIAFVDQAHGWVVGSGGTILATTDGGKTWKRQRSGTKLDLCGVAFADVKHGLAVGNRFKGDDPLADTFLGSIILRTTDGGATWTR